MEPAAAGILYAAESLVQGAAALVKGVTHPTHPIEANLTRISSVPLPRLQHTISVVKNRAYIFGGEKSPGQLADNDMHIVILPSSGVLDADYTSKPAQAANGFDDVPGPRKGHTAVVIGDTIYVLGGEGDNVTNENGRMWAYHTESNKWSFLDPAPGTFSPSPRVGHSSASSDEPAAKGITYQEKAPQQPADPSKNVPEPPESWGTVFVVGGRELTGELATSALAFDVSARAWSEIPPPPGQPREGASLAMAGNRLYLFGGKSIETSASAALDYLEIAPGSSSWAWKEVVYNESGAQAVPEVRSNAGLVEVTTGQGRHYLLAIGGNSGTSKILDDIWTFQLPPEHATAAAAKDAIRSTIKRNTHEATWAEVLYDYVDSKGEEEAGIPGEQKRGLGNRHQFAVAKGTEVDGATCVVWGGVDSNNSVLSDGWLITVDR